MRTRKPNESLSLAEIRKVISRHKEKGRELVAEAQKLQAHAVKLEEYYSAWEDDFVAIQKHIDNVAEENDMIPQDVEKVDVLDDVFGGLDD